MNSTSRSTAKRSSALTLLLLALAFLTPTLGAWLLYQYMSAQGSIGTAAHGELLLPPRRLPVLDLAREDGSPFPTSTLQGKWTLMYLAASPCSEQCASRLAELRQVRLATGEEMLRVQRLWVMTARGPGDDLASIQANHPELLLAEVPGAARADFYGSLAGDAGPLTAPEGHVYLVDPLGNVVLRYAVQVPAKGLLRDLQRLLKASRIG